MGSNSENSSVYEKYIWTFGYLVHQVNSLEDVLKLKLNFQTNKVVTSKTLFFVIVPFCIPHSICLNIGLWQGCFVKKCCVFSLSTFNQKTLSQFFVKYWKKLKYWKCSKFPVIVKQKTYRLSNKALFWKSLVLFSRRT